MEGIPQGLEYLAYIDHLMIHKEAKCCKTIIECEPNNKFEVLNSAGQKVYAAKEKTNCCVRITLGRSRPMNIKIFDSSKREVIRLRRALACTSCWFPCCLQVLSVNGSSHIGNITRRWPGVCRTLFTDAHEFNLTFPSDLEVKMKAVLIGACLLISMLLIVMCQSGGVGASRILGIFPTPSISHQLPYQAFMKTLAARGHEVTVMSTDPLKDPVDNYTDIDFSFSYIYKQKYFRLDTSLSNAFTFMRKFMKLMAGGLDEQLSSTEMNDFLRTNKNKTFDLVILEWNGYYSYFGLIHAIGSPPTVGIVSYSGTHGSYNDLGAPNSPAVHPQMFLEYSDKMTFWQRVFNTYSYLWLCIGREWYVKPTQDAIMRKNFGFTLPDISEFQYNMSLMVVNSDWLIDYPRPLLPNIVQVAGIHIKDQPRPLPEDLQQWMDDVKPGSGVVYMSLGSNVLSKDLPESKRTAILRAFARLPFKVLWKFESDDLHGLPGNVRVSKWLPQQAVLAHPNVRLFVTQGGLQSFQEAVYHAVPLLAIPILFDQHFNAEKIVTSQVGKKMDYYTLDENILYSQIMEIICNQSYKDNARKLSAVFREHKASSLENAMWWVEYVLRHKGAPHLRSSALHLSWYQYLLLDVLAVLLLATYALYFVIRTTSRILYDLIINHKNNSNEKYKAQ